MNTETINTQLYEKMFAEQERYRDWLLHQPPEEILNHTYEYTTREDILMTLEDNDFSFEQAWALLSSSTPLADVFKEFENPRNRLHGCCAGKHGKSRKHDHWQESSAALSPRCSLCCRT